MLIPEDNKELHFKGLSNEQIVMIYYRFKRYKDVLDTNLPKNIVPFMVNAPVLGKIPAMKAISDENVEKFLKTDFYRITGEIISVLEPIVKIIEENDEDVKKILDELQ